MYGNIKLEPDVLISSMTIDDAGDVLVDLLRGVTWPFLERMESVEFRLVAGGIGGSEMMERRVSAPTIPPIEWPRRITRTDGSMVGDGVAAETSRSMTLF